MPRPKSRRWMLLLAILALAALYMVPRTIRAGIEGYRVGSEIRAQQGR